MPKQPSISKANDPIPFCVSVVLKHCKMKINEKNLACFASCNSSTDKEGYLLKRGEVNRQFQKRWFVLKGNLLFYFDKRFDREPIGVIVLEGCTVELAEHEHDAYAFQLVFHGAGSRTYVMCASSQEEMEAWMKLMAGASYDYLKMMVGELNRQLDEVTKSSRFVEQKSEHVASQDTAETTSTDALSYRETTKLGPGHERYNPFDKSEHCATNESGCGSGTSVIKSSFQRLHEKYGKLIQRILRQRGSSMDLSVFLH